MKQRKWLYFIIVVAVYCMLLQVAEVSAKEHTIPFDLSEEEEHEMTITVGDTGKFEIPQVVSANGIEKKVSDVKITTIDYDSDYDILDDYDTEGEMSASNVLNVDKEGNFFTKAFGKVKVTITLYFEDRENDGYYNGYYDGYYNGYYGGYYDYYYDTLEYSYIVTVIPDMTKVTIKGNSQTKYISKDNYGWGYNIPAYEFYLDSDTPLSENNYGINVDFSSSNSGITVSGELSKNKITLYPSNIGSTTVTITICEKDFQVNIKTIAVGINKNSLLLAKGKSSKLKISGKPSKIKWTSSNKRIAAVSSNGTIKARKTGNVVIKAKMGEISLGCAVSVVTDNRLKVIKRAKQIAKTCTYSQPKRMQSNYYDCSSLVWKAYSKYGQNFGNRSYAPVAADLGKWCANRKKLVKGGVIRKNLQKMKFRPGDLYFVTGSNNGRYQGISHVEMISGYVCYGFDSKGNPILELDYVNRYPGKYYGGMVGQP